MKKFLSLLMAFVMVLSLAACGKDESKNLIKSDKPEESTSDTSKVEREEQSKTPETVDVLPGVDGVSADVIPFEEPFVFVDNDEYVWKIVGVDTDTWDDFALEVYVENKTTDKDLLFNVADMTVNGVYEAGSFSWPLKPGESDFVHWGLNSYMHADADIGGWTDLFVSWEIKDENDWNAEPFETGTTHVYPYGEAEAIDFRREPADTDVVIVDEDKVKMTVIGYSMNEDGNFLVHLYIETTVGVPLMCVPDNELLNGNPVTLSFAHEIGMGDRSFVNMPVEKETLQEYNISSVDTLTFDMRVYNYDDYSDCFAEKTIELRPNFSVDK